MYQSRSTIKTANRKTHYKTLLALERFLLKNFPLSSRDIYRIMIFIGQLLKEARTQKAKHKRLARQS